jgi:hypothetical protein
LHLSQLGPSQPIDPRARALARRVAKSFRARSQRHVAKSELKALSKRRPGAVRFTPSPDERRADALARHVRRTLGRSRRGPGRDINGLKALSQRRLGVVRFTRPADEGLGPQA